MVQQSLNLDSRKFVYVKTDFIVDGEMVLANEVGIVQHERQDSCTILIVRLSKCVDLPRSDYEFFAVNEVGDAFPKKVCNVCQRYLDTTLFEFNQNARDNRRVRRPSCRECRIKIDGVDSSPAERVRWERIRPNLVPFKCPICKKTTIPGLTSKIVLDHDHTTGRIRGWICDSCNTGIGRFKDDVELLKSAIKYLETE